MATMDEFVEAVEQRYPGRRCVLSTTDVGWAVLDRIGPRWIGAVIDSVLLIDPDARVELVLSQSDSEPLSAGGWIQPGTAGSAYLDARAVGRLSLVPADSDAPVIKREVAIPGLELLDGTGSVVFGAGRGLIGQKVGGLYGAIFDRAPLALDMWKQARNSMTWGRARDAQPLVGRVTSLGAPERGIGRRSGPGHENDDAENGGAENGGAATPTAWFAIHWLEPGGAEVWALDSARMAKELGYRVVITTDVAAPQRWLDRALEITEHVYLPSNVLGEKDWGAFLRGILERYEPDVLYIHHSARAYSYLPELRHLCPGVLVLDSTHIVEHRTGGFVRQSIEYSNLIDHHHVISPELRDLYLLDAGIPRERVHYHPLTHGQEPALGQDPRRRDLGPLRVGFLGRISAQKRPFLFVEVARRLHKAAPDRFSFAIQGSGPLDGLLDSHLQRSGLTGVVARRPWGPVEQFLSEIDVLLVASDNEGLTLTSLEADEHGVLVLSADVGSQATVVPADLLLPRAPRAFCRGAVRVLRRLADVPGAFDSALAEQDRLVTALRTRPGAPEYLRPLLQNHLESAR